MTDFRIGRWIATGACVFGALAGAARAEPAAATSRLLDDEQLVARVLELADQRLQLMPAVAAAKWPRHLPVADPPREAIVERAAAESAARVGLLPKPVERLVAVQIGLARAAEDALYARWDRSGYDVEGSVPDLARDLRPQLDRLAEAAIEALYLAEPALARSDFPSWASDIAHRALPDSRWSEADRNALMAALGAVRFAGPATVARAHEAGTLRVGTTGDYAPFSVARDGALAGSDVELARDLGASLGLRVVYIRTSWRTLLDDLRADRFDVAVGGISVTDARKALAEFSLPIARSGKTAIGRCADSARLTTFSAIDVPTVTVIVNPGGTNELFVRDHVHGAHVLVHPDNRTVFEEILARHADVMFTDETEVALATHRHAELCRLLKDSFDPADKAFLMMAGSGWPAAVNPWLQKSLAEGTPARLLSDYLAR